MKSEISPFEFVNDITHLKKNILNNNPELEDSYNSFIINRALSHYKDTIFFSNIMNMRSPHISKKAQFDFYFNIIRPYKRFSLWPKKQESETQNFLQEYYGFSSKKAKMAEKIISKQQLDILKEKTRKGGETKYEK